ncbi:MAG: YwiC-like family protein [Acidobacteriota bacterium]
MSTNVLAIDSRPKVRLKSVALPIEHGSWGFLFEPLVAGIAIAPSKASPWIAFFVIGAFMIRQPLKVVLSDWRSRRWLPQTRYAVRFLLFYAVVFCVGLIGSVSLASPESFVPFAIVLPFAAFQIYCDSQRNSRLLLAEILGAVSISSSIAVLALADSWLYPNAYALWAIIVARLIPSILYVRNRLNIEKGKSYSRAIPISAHFAALIIVLLLAFYDLGPFLPVLMFLVLLIRSIIGLSPFRKKVKAIKLGIGEVIYGTLTVISLIVGYYAGI